jgi:hypothetical protein
MATPHGYNVLESNKNVPQFAMQAGAYFACSGARGLRLAGA